MNKLPERLKQLRKDKNLSQQDLSMELKIPRTTISSWESGSRIPELMNTEKLADFFNVPLDYLLGRIDSKNSTYVEYVAQSIFKVIQHDCELADFIEKLTYRSDLHTISKKLKDLSPDSVHRLIRVIDALEITDSSTEN